MLLLKEEPSEPAASAQQEPKDLDEPAQPEESRAVPQVLEVLVLTDAPELAELSAAQAASE